MESSSVCDEISEAGYPEAECSTPGGESLDYSRTISEISTYSEPSSSDEPLHSIWPLSSLSGRASPVLAKLGMKRHARAPSLKSGEDQEEESSSEVELMRERFSKLLLGEDMSGSGKGVCTAVAISNAITNLYATVFGQCWRLEPLSPEKKRMWRREMDCLLSVCDYIVELCPSLQTLADGTTLEVMESRPRSDIYVNLPALEKLDAMLLDILDSFRNTEFWYEEAPKQNPTGSKSKPETRRSLAPSLNGWQPLPVPRSELYLPLTLPTGQTFRWRPTSASAFTGVIGPHLISLRHVDDSPECHVEFLNHNPDSSPAAARLAIDGYFNLGVDLGEMWRGFAGVDERFAELARRFDGGARVLRQDPVECLFQFLCSSNNNIGRIEKMVGVISSFGRYLGTVCGLEFYEFPTIERLAVVTEAELRDAGFGYRAKYVVGTAKALQSKPGGGAMWLASLRGLELNEVIAALCTLPGVGPKVAACIALFSLDQHHAIPVDTHVWQIATRHLLPELAGMQLTPKLHSRVSDAFVSKFGKYAGWAQNVLFIGELPSQKALVATADDAKSTKRKRARNKVTVQVFVESG